MHAAAHFIKYNSIMLWRCPYFCAAALYGAIASVRLRNERASEMHTTINPKDLREMPSNAFGHSLFLFSACRTDKLTLGAAGRMHCSRETHPWKCTPVYMCSHLRFSLEREMIFTADLKARVRHFAITLSAIHEVGSDPCRVQSLYTLLPFVCLFIHNGWTLF